MALGLQGNCPGFGKIRSKLAFQPPEARVIAALARFHSGKGDNWPSNGLNSWVTGSILGLNLGGDRLANRKRALCHLDPIKIWGCELINFLFKQPIIHFFNGGGRPNVAIFFQAMQANSVVQALVEQPLVKMAGSLPAHRLVPAEHAPAPLTKPGSR